VSRPRLFERQLRRVGASADVAPTLEQWRSYLDHVERTYAAAEQDRYTIERSLAISSDEMRALYDNLKHSSESLLSIERDKLKKSVEIAEQASRAKSEFLRNMSHEMRTPLNAILGFARVLERENRTATCTEHREFLQNIVQASEHMLALVNDLLDLRSLEEIRPQATPIALPPIIQETIGLVRSLVDEKSLVMTIDIAADLPLVVAERRAVVQILMNLISNAAKFTPAGGNVALSARSVASRVHVSVQDTGIGIAPEDQRKLFTYFEQVGGKHAHNMKGSGVGLALTRALVERQGGEITVHSKLGSGSTFDFHLPAVP
jgi:two-component system cell cycle sensor histidine kinase PleC